MKKLLKYFSIFEWCLYIAGVITVILCFVLFENKDVFNLIGSLIGITALIFLSKGNPIGLILSIVFSVFYGVVSWSYKYYGEMITYLLMTTPISIASLVSWFKNPYKGNKAEVEINEISKKEVMLLSALSIVVTIAFYFILKALNTNNLIVSTISILTSFVACYLSLRRNRYYALAYATNDIVLIILWVLASFSSIEYVSMVICFLAFLANDIYGFVNWSKMLKRQKKGNI